MASPANDRKAETVPFGIVKRAGLVALLGAAAGSMFLMFHAPQHPPALLRVMFVVWILAPFAGLWICHLLSVRWPARVRATLYITTLVVALGSLAVYVDDALDHRTAHPAFVYVAVPPASALFAVTVITLAATLSRKRPGHDPQSSTGRSS